MQRFLMFGAIMIMQGVVIAPVRALAQNDAGRNAAGYGAYDSRSSGTSSGYAPPAGDQGGGYPPGGYGYPAPQPYPAQSYPAQPYPVQSYPAQPAPPQATSPNAVCPNGRFFDHMTKSCESP